VIEVGQRSVAAHALRKHRAEVQVVTHHDEAVIARVCHDNFVSSRRLADVRPMHGLVTQRRQ
jgi:hypothetical protein